MSFWHHGAHERPQAAFCRPTRTWRTYCVDAVELLGSVEQNNGDELPADSAVGEELPWSLGLDTCYIVPLLFDVVPHLVTSVAVQKPEGLTQESTRTLAVTAASTTCLLTLLSSDQAAGLLPLYQTFSLENKKHPEAK